VNISILNKANGNYINSMLARSDREWRGGGAAALEQRNLQCGRQWENVFMVRDDKIYAPELTSCLEGYPARDICPHAAELGYEIRESALLAMRCMLQ
jgi:branched-chain amino acid aminotransferase